MISWLNIIIHIKSQKKFCLTKFGGAFAPFAPLQIRLCSLRVDTWATARQRYGLFCFLGLSHLCVQMPLIFCSSSIHLTENLYYMLVAPTYSRRFRRSTHTSNCFTINVSKMHARVFSNGKLSDHRSIKVTIPRPDLSALITL